MGRTTTAGRWGPLPSRPAFPWPSPRRQRRGQQQSQEEARRRTLAITRAEVQGPLAPSNHTLCSYLLGVTGRPLPGVPGGLSREGPIGSDRGHTGAAFLPSG